MCLEKPAAVPSLVSLCRVIFKPVSLKTGSNKRDIILSKYLNHGKSLLPYK